MARYDTGQRWYDLSDMGVNEVLLIQILQKGWVKGVRRYRRLLRILVPKTER